MAAQEKMIIAQHEAQLDAKRKAMTEVAQLLIEARRSLLHCAPCKECSIIATKIEETLLWAHAAMISSPSISFGFIVTADTFNLENFLAGPPSDDGKT